MAVYVDLAINIAGVYGMATAVRSLHECGVAPAVIQRVLIDSGPRRGATTTPSQPETMEQEPSEKLARLGA